MSSDIGRQMKLALFVSNAGAHPAGWRAPQGGPIDQCDIDAYVQAAQIAERGKFHLYFSGDAQGYQAIEGREAFAQSDNAGKLEPIVLLSALAMVTKHIGLAATASTSYNEPFALARRFAALDHVSRGRAGWNVVTSTTDNEAHNFGLDAHLDHALRYERAEEFVDVVKALWDCWEDDAVERNAATGRYFDPAKVHGLGHKGRFFKVAGPLNVCRPPQGHPVIIQAGGSEPGRRLAARTADLIFAAHNAKDRAKGFYDDMKARAAAAGRSPDALQVMASVQFLIRSTEAEARKAEKELVELISPEFAIAKLQMLLGDIDLSALDPNGPLPPLSSTNSSQSIQRTLLATAEAENLTLLQLALKAAVGRVTYTQSGTPEQVADLCEDWFRSGAADGFSLAVNYWPDGVADFVDHVVPILQRRGLFRTDYVEGTLRDNLALPRPANLFATGAIKGVEPEIWAKAAHRA